MKRLALVAAMAGTSLFGFVAPAAHADDTCNGVAIHVQANINGNQQGTDQCIPLSAPSLP